MMIQQQHLYGKDEKPDIEVKIRFGPASPDRITFAPEYIYIGFYRVEIMSERVAEIVWNATYFHWRRVLG
jgi:hypothetical protein